MDFSALKKSCKRRIIGKELKCQVLEFEIDTFIKEFDLTVTLRGCFVEDQVLKDLAKKKGKTESEILKEDIIPDDGSVVSGDFCEILYARILERVLPIKFFDTRWHHKFHKNELIPGSDLLGSVTKDKNPHPEDELVVLESKAAFSQKNKELVQNAFNSMKKDYLGRAGISLFAIMKRRTIANAGADTSDIERFVNRQKYPEFQLKLVGGVATKSEYWEDDHFVNAKHELKDPPYLIIATLFDDPWPKIQELFEKCKK